MSEADSIDRKLFTDEQYEALDGAYSSGEIAVVLLPPMASFVGIVLFTLYASFQLASTFGFVVGVVLTPVVSILVSIVSLILLLFSYGHFVLALARWRSN